jgi:polysaccharide biosynthesis protein PslH
VRILWIATKAPWPPVDGGRLLSALTIEALAAAGHPVTVVMPSTVGSPVADQEGLPCRLVAVPTRAPSTLRAILRSFARGLPITMARHTFVEVDAAVSGLLAGGSFDVVHVEQPHGLAHARAAAARGIPVVLRAQNVESDLWSMAARRRPFLRWEAARVARFEGDAVRRVGLTIALTAPDATRLSELSRSPSGIRHVPAPFPARWPAAPRLPGRPAVVLFGSPDWWPNREATRWFLREVWPQAREALPRAHLHLFGASGRDREGIAFHAPPGRSVEAFAEGSVLVVPLRAGSGVRMKILEAWARGIAVVATPVAASGLDVEDGQELLLARNAREFVAALVRVDGDPASAAALARAGRELLVRDHDPATVAAAMVSAYSTVR